MRRLAYWVVSAFGYLLGLALLLIVIGLVVSLFTDYIQIGFGVFLVVVVSLFACMMLAGRLDPSSR